jgi:hypothetical protein
MAFCQAKSAFDTLLALFLGPEQALTDLDRRGGALTTLNYLPTLMLNVRGVESRMVQAWAGIPSADLVRRAHYLAMLANVAADRADPAVQRPIHALLRGVLFDRSEASQLRVLALNLLTRKLLTLEDAMRMKQAMAGEKEPMAGLFSDFLFEYF